MAANNFLRSGHEHTNWRSAKAAASEAIKPGMLLALNSSGEFIKHATLGRRPLPPMIAEAEGFTGGLYDLRTYANISAYADGQSIHAPILQPGFEVDVWLAPSQTVAVDDKLQSNGAGLVMECADGSGVVEGTSTTVAYDDLTDGGAAAGTLALTGFVPANAVLEYTKVVVATGFTGDTSAVFSLGVSGDADAFSEVTSNSVFAAGTFIVVPDAAGADNYGAAATDGLLTITSDSDFTSVSAGSLVLTPYYRFLGGEPLLQALEAVTTNSSTTSRIKTMVV